MKEWNMHSASTTKVTEERRALFERFIHEIAKYPFLLESEECGIFFHMDGEVTERLKKLPKPKPGELL